jgi:hypothetical protein
MPYIMPICQETTQNQSRGELTLEGNQRQYTTGERRKKENRRAEERIVDLFNKDNFPSMTNYTQTSSPDNIRANSQEPQNSPASRNKGSRRENKRAQSKLQGERKDTINIQEPRKNEWQTPLNDIAE